MVSDLAGSRCIIALLIFRAHIPARIRTWRQQATRSPCSLQLATPRKTHNLESKDPEPRDQRDEHDERIGGLRELQGEVEVSCDAEVLQGQGEAATDRRVIHGHQLETGWWMVMSPEPASLEIA